MRRIFAFSLTYLLLTQVSFAEDRTKCYEHLVGTLKTETEKLIVKNHPSVMELFDIKCDESIFDPQSVSDGVVLVHEAAHFEDLGLDPKVGDTGEFNIILTDGTRIGGIQNFSELPNVQKVIQPHVVKNYSDLNDEMYFHYHQTYVASDNAMAAEDLRGMSTELNAYLHGLRYEYRMKKIEKYVPEIATFIDENGKSHSFPNPMIEVSQSDGAYYFLMMFGVYFNEIKAKHPSAWKSLQSETNRNFIQSLLRSAISALDETESAKAIGIEGATESWRILLKRDGTPSKLRDFISPSELEKVL